MNDTDLNQNQQRKPDLYWLRNIQEGRKCGAKTRSGTPCSKWALKGKTRCRNHGGLSTGPRVPYVTTGEHSLIVLKAQLMTRIESAAKAEADTARLLSGYLSNRFSAINRKEFQRIRPALIAFCRGEISARLAVEVVENKRQYITTKSEGF